MLLTSPNSALPVSNFALRSPNEVANYTLCDVVRHLERIMGLHDNRGRTITSFRVSITDRCNLRCRYCMPEDGVPTIEHADILRYEEIERLIRIALRLDITKVRITGGEPLVRIGALEFLERLGKIEELQTLTLTTNGILLNTFAERLRAANVAYVNISLDTLDRQKFRDLTQRDHIDAVLQGIRTATRTGFTKVNVNVVSLRGYNDDEVFDFVTFADTYNVNVRFIEYMPFSGNGWQREHFLASSELKQRLEQRYALIPLNGDPTAASRNYRIEGLRGSIGFISPVSQRFCDVCNRLRLTADGFLRPCLHGPIEIDVKGPLRRGASDDELAELFREAVRQKPDSHHNFSGSRDTSGEQGRAMVRIGG